MEDGLLEAIGLASMFGGGGDPTLTATADDLMDPGGFYRSQGLDPYGRPLPTVKTPKAPGKLSGVGRAANKIAALRDGYETAVNPLVRNQTAAIGKGVRGASKLAGFSPSAAGNAGRMAMQALKNPLLQTGMKYAPVVGTALSVGDVVFGDESLANKGMDAALMGVGGVLGSAVPVVGTGLGIAGGKMLSDAIQFIGGGGKSPEERRMEEALMALNGGVV